MISNHRLSKIGIGTWGIGGFAKRNIDNYDEKQIDAIAYMIDSGLNYIELNIWTAEGHSVELVSKAIKKSRVDRDNLFLSQAIYSYTAPNLIAAKKELDACLKTFKTNYVDSLSLNEAAIASIGYEQVITWFKQLLKDKIIRYINFNNPSFERIIEARKIFDDKLFSIEIGFNFEIRENKKNGIIDYANKNKILCVIYQPLRRNRTALRNWPILIKLSKKYNRTQNQILLNWICSKGFLPLTKSETIEHIKEHLDSLQFTMDQTDLKQLDEFRPPNYIPPNPYWGVVGSGIRIDQLSNVFDEDFDNQTKTK